MTRFLSWAFLLAAVPLAGLALYSYAFPGVDLPAFAVPVTERDLGSQPVGKLPLTFDITNRSGVVRRVLGLAEG